MASDEKRILLVEDEKAIRDAVAAYLERENYAVRGVGDGQSALEEFEKHREEIVKRALADACTVANPRKVEAKDINRILDKIAK